MKEVWEEMVSIPILKSYKENREMENHNFWSIPWRLFLWCWAHFGVQHLFLGGHGYLEDEIDFYF